MTAEATIDHRQDGQKTLLIEQLRRTPIVQVACEKTGIGRASYYRWRKDDEEFAKACDEAMQEGVELVSDLAESKLINSIKEQNHGAISFWLRHRHPAYADKLQVRAKVETDNSLTPEQEELVRRALGHVTGGRVADLATVELYDGHE
ncbi:MAG: hypothetical protein UY72_C0022G0001 [Candidatus Uhrbacteria bacterium GW2011_GWD2_52_7]|uniref:Uncharacterized protein n=1 Tax=Candidatus Uhrbacteria bacterium GW2011_GWD2_52_7 TaxID=1618989 RepID=A0A0G1ZPM4_9BACT|nr:MAG: hypothetical protein UY72_C0022G0001 [Candidatus Uhrbacteria bacterium GW2011_GWD2_52_7]